MIYVAQILVVTVKESINASTQQAAHVSYNKNANLGTASMLNIKLDCHVGRTGNKPNTIWLNSHPKHLFTKFFDYCTCFKEFWSLLVHIQ